MLRFPDLAVLFLTTAITVFCTISIYGKSASSVQFIIQGKNERWVYSVDHNAKVEIAGPLGTTIVELKDARAQVVFSPCVNQICTASGVIQRRGQWIACLPNVVFVRAEGENTEGTDVDGVSW